MVTMAFERTIVSGGKKYRQLVESRWDKEKKQSRLHVIKHLGRVEEKNGEQQLIPSQLKIDTVDKACPVGELALYWKLAHEFEVEKCVDHAAGKDKKGLSMAVLVLVLNQLMGRKPLTRIGDWVASTPIPRWANVNPEKMTKDYFLSALDEICEDNGSVKTSCSYGIQHGLVKSWRRIVGNEPARFFFYQDITRIRWNGDVSFWAENGYGAQAGRPHIGYGLVVSRDNHMPVMGYPVRGSKTDKTTVEETVVHLARLNLRNVTLVWDRGFVSKHNLDRARDEGFHVLSAGPRTSNEVVDWIVAYDDSEVERREQVYAMSHGKGVYCVETVGELFGHECRIVVMLDPDRRNRQRVERDLLLQELESETSRQRRIELKKLLKPIVVPARGRKGYEIDRVEEERARRLDGRTMLFCTDTSMSGKEIVRAYFQKDIVEKAFRSLKGDACLAPVRYQLPGRVEAYLSVVNFIAYMLIAAILWKIREHQISISFEDLINEASNIYEVEFTSKNKKIHKWTHISRDMEKILKPFDILTLKT
jgi:hypothetical protein